MQMGRPSKYKRGPIFLLRAILGGAKPVTQSELERMIDIPFATIQAAESAREGERALSQALRHNIRIETGCLWDPIKRRWQFDRKLLEKVNPGEDRFVPATAALVSQYRAIIANPFLSDEDKQEDTEIFKGWLEELCKRTSGKYWHRFLTRFSEFTENCCREFRLGDPVEFFDTATNNSEDIRLALMTAQPPSLPKLEDKMRKAVLAFDPDTEEGKAYCDLRDTITDYNKAYPPKTRRKRK
jgi:hypothetical protein